MWLFIIKRALFVTLDLQRVINNRHTPALHFCPLTKSLLRWNATIKLYLFAWKSIWAFSPLSHRCVQLPAAKRHFPGDSVVLVERQEFTNRGGKPRLLRRRAQARSQTRQAETQPAQSGVLLLTGHARTHGKGMQALVTGQVWSSVDWSERHTV